MFLLLYNTLTGGDQIVLVSISNIKKRISFSILLNIKLDLFHKALSNFYKYFAIFESFLVSRVGIINDSLNMLVIVIAFLQFLFWIKIMLHYNYLKVSYLLPNYIGLK